MNFNMNNLVFACESSTSSKQKRNRQKELYIWDTAHNTNHYLNPHSLTPVHFTAVETQHWHIIIFLVCTEHVGYLHIQQQTWSNTSIHLEPVCLPWATLTWTTGKLCRRGTHCVLSSVSITNPPRGVLHCALLQYVHQRVGNVFRLPFGAMAMTGGWHW